jgi:hypothetical protein
MAVGSAITMKLISIVIGIPVGIMTKKAVEKTWIAARPEDPPRTPSQRDVSWSDAVGWAALSAAGIVIAELVTKRSAEVAFRSITGNEPPAPKPTKAEKKAHKALEKAAD